jgi:MbtH protein
MTDKTKARVNAYTIDGDLFKAIINDEEQYSIWPEQKETPAGWREVGVKGSKAEVSEYIDKNWTDMRPLSLRKAMEANARK